MTQSAKSSTPFPPSARRRTRDARNIAALLLLASTAWAADVTAPPAADTPTDDDLQIPEVFTSHLPRTLATGSLHFFVHPHFGDLSSRDHVRITSGLRYGLTRHWEVSADADGFFSHGLGDVALFKRAGVSKLRLGTKYNLGNRPFAQWQTAVGFDFTTPIGRPPAELTDGMRHFAPYLVASRRLTAHPDIRIFWGAGLDLVSHTDLPAEQHKNQLGAHATELSAGAVWDRRRVHYTFEMAWASTRLLGHTRDDTLTLRPGVIWELPWFRSRRHPGRIILVGAALRTSFGPDGTAIGGSAKLRINFDPKSHRRAESVPAP